MKRAISSIVFLIIVVTTVAEIPDFNLKSANNNKYYNLHDVKGEQVTVIDFWATWCKPCVKAIPKLSVLSEEFKDEGVAFIGISTDGPRNQSKVRPFISANKIPYTVLLDPDRQLMDALHANVLPTLLIFNKKGEMVYLHEGFKAGDEKEIKDQIKNLLNN